MKLTLSRAFIMRSLCLMEELTQPLRVSGLRNFLSRLLLKQATLPFMTAAGRPHSRCSLTCSPQLPSLPVAPPAIAAEKPVLHGQSLDCRTLGSERRCRRRHPTLKNGDPIVLRPRHAMQCRRLTADGRPCSAETQGRTSTSSHRP